VSTTGRYEFPVSIAAAEAEFAEALNGEHGARPAIIKTGGGWPTKLWPADGYARIVDLLWTEYGLRSAITFGPGEEGLAQGVIEQSRSGAGVAVKSTLKQYYALARRASIFVGGDTGPMHLAAAAGAPVVGLFGPSSARRNGPLAKADRVVERTDLECRIDCYRRSCGHTLCMRIPVAAVWEQVERVILEQMSSPLRESERA
jgi:ADP-heptose:LPS heptosyltransferase